MKKSFIFSAIILIWTFLSVSCTNNKSADNQTKNDLTLSSEKVNTSLPALISLIQEIQQQQSFKEDDEKKQKLIALQQLLAELTRISDSSSSILSDPITFQDFTSRRADFKREFPALTHRKIFPIFFEIDKKSIKQLYNFAEKVDSLDVLRFYPVYDTRLATKYSHAFLWANSKSTAKIQENTKLIIDIINPCPPGCDSTRAL